MQGDGQMGPDGSTDASGQDARPDAYIHTCGDEVPGPSPTPLVSIPAGEFMMGCNDAVDPDCATPPMGQSTDNEKPYHRVMLPLYQIDETEVTQRQYLACVQAGQCSVPDCRDRPTDWDPCLRANYPVVCVDWAQAKAYCTFVGKRLPTEAEWEKAARGADGRIFPWGNDAPTCTRSNHGGASGGCGNTLMQVKSLPDGKSPYDIYEMAGNVVEMVADWYSGTYYNTVPPPDLTTNPQGPAMGTCIVGPDQCWVGRGGGFGSPSHYLRSSDRDSYNVDDVGPRLGFRCAKTPPD